MLDVVRFLAALWVMVSHAHAVGGGGHAVSVFFVLSGYLIGGQLVHERRHGTIRIREFYFKRITRIWVPYFIVLIAMVALFMIRGKHRVPGFYEPLIGAMTYTYSQVNEIRGYIHPVWRSFNHIWSLSIEEQFYLVVPLWIAWMPVRSIAPASLLLTVLFLFAMPYYAGLALGVLLAAMLEGVATKGLAPRASMACRGGLLAAGVLLFAVGQTRISQISWITYGLSGVVVLLAGSIDVPRRIHPGLRYLGLMTYSYYLIHSIPRYFLSAAYHRLSGGAIFPVWLGVASGLLALPISYLFVRWVEMPVLRVRGEMLKSGSPWVGYAPMLAWGLSLVGVVGLFSLLPR
jgi:peptidoglycan/LPS O-acetylase OafA/YrhL